MLRLMGEIAREKRDIREVESSPIVILSHQLLSSHFIPISSKFGPEPNYNIIHHALRIPFVRIW